METLANGSTHQEESSKTHTRRRKKKGFKFYLLEFALMFLAVFLGFLAENLRESLSDRAKERELIGSMIQNLKDDSKWLADKIEKNKTKGAALDSLLKYNDKDHTDRAVLDAFASLAQTGLCCNYVFRSNDATLSQLKFAEGYRLLSVRVADSIADYSVKLAEVYREETHYEHNNFVTTDLFFTIGDMTDIRQVLGNRNTNITVHPEKLEVFYNYVLNLFFSVRGYNRLLIKQKAEADKLIVFLKKEYEMED